MSIWRPRCPTKILEVRIRAKRGENFEYFLQRGGGRHTGNTGSPAAIGRGGLLLFQAEGEEGVRRVGSGLENRNLTTPHTRVGKNRT